MVTRPGSLVYLTVSCYDGAGKYLVEKYLKAVKLLSELDCFFLQKTLSLANVVICCMIRVLEYLVHCVYPKNDLSLLEIGHFFVHNNKLCFYCSNINI